MTIGGKSFADVPTVFSAVTLVSVPSLVFLTFGILCNNPYKTTIYRKTRDGAIIIPDDENSSTQLVKLAWILAGIKIIWASNKTSVKPQSNLLFKRSNSCI
ncbi:hypothetical protein RvY_18553 [Ramazzottius varieornatus]|uniref:Uncharacterized protein n=1 Tax=Ramazzottius varieornatus TaxID=947166 RepID=A0A1D1W684_RAMVA|nr:hypothetical protein RvY_18553 [Ramazzottius varieornatus]